MNQPAGSPEESAIALRRKLGLSTFLDRKMLDAIVGELGIKQTDAMTRLHSGSVSKTPSGWRITISEFDHADRQLFTLAHELGHVVFGFEQVGRDTNEEWWCNKFAAELLMPRDLVLSRFSKADRPMYAAMELSRVGNVSINTAFIRLREICRWKVGLICFRRSGNRWRVISTTALPRSAMIVVLPGRDITHQLIAPIRFPRKIDLSLLIAGKEMTVAAEVYGRGGYRWALMTPSELRHAIHIARSSSPRLPSGD